MCIWGNREDDPIEPIDSVMKIQSVKPTFGKLLAEN